MNKVVSTKAVYESPALRFAEFELSYAILGLSYSSYEVENSGIEIFKDGGDL